MRPKFNLAQMFLLTALVGLAMALLTAVYTRARSMFHPEAISYSPDGEALAVQFSDGTVNVWNQAGRQIGSVDTRQDWISLHSDSSIQMAADQRLVVSKNRSQFEVWDVASGRHSRLFGPLSLSPFESSTAISGDGRTIAGVVVASNSRTEIWDTQTGKRVKRLPNAIATPTHVALSNDGRRLLAISRGGKVSTWDIETEEQIAGPHSLQSLPEPSKRLLASDNLEVMATFKQSSYDDQLGIPVLLMNTINGQQAEIHVPEGTLSLRLSPDGSVLAVAGLSNIVTLIDTGDGQTLREFTLSDVVFQQEFNVFAPLHQNKPAIDFSPDGQTIAVAINDEIGLYDVASGQRAKSLWRSRQQLGGFFFAPALIIWAVLWGLVRRQDSNGPLLEIETTTETTAEELARIEDSIGTEEPPGADESTEAEAEESDGTNERPFNAAAADECRLVPPLAFYVVWVMWLIGGIGATLWGTMIIFSQFTCLAFAPMPYFCLYVGLAATSSAVARRVDRLSLICSLQVINLICCDPLNFVLGLAGIVLIHRRDVANYQQGTNA